MVSSHKVGGATAAIAPLKRIRDASVCRTTRRPIKVPSGPGAQLAAPWFVEIGAEPEAVDIVSEEVELVVV